MNNSPDTRLSVAGNQRRRQIIRYLRHQDNSTVTFESVVDQIGDRSRGNDPQQTREQIAIELHHTHLPKLADHGIVQYHHGDGTVQYRGDDRVEALLDSLAVETVPQL